MVPASAWMIPPHPEEEKVKNVTRLQKVYTVHLSVLYIPDESVDQVAVNPPLDTE